MMVDGARLASYGVDMSRLTSREIAADVVAMMQHLGWRRDIAERSWSAELAMIGITEADLVEAAKRRAGAGWAPMSWPDRPADPPRDARRSTRKSRETADGVELWCSGHEAEVGHWAPEDEFRARADRPHLRRSKCDRHRKMAKRASAVSARVARDLASFGLKATVTEGGRLKGVECSTCGARFTAGTMLAGEVNRHTREGCQPRLVT